MEVNKKLRGQKHHHNKARYQNKAKIVSKTTETSREQPEREKGLTSNWHRYEESSEEEKLDESTNFALLAQAPISHGGHFQFKSDKNVESEFDFETLRKNKMFALDLFSLEGGLSTIPFHTRCGLDESYFTDTQLKEINIRARQNKAQYESYVKMNSITKDFLSQKLSDNKSDKNDEQFKTNIDTLLTTKVQPLQGCSNKIESTKTVGEVPDCATHSRTENVSKNDDLKQDKEALEEWLDDILND